MNQIMLARLRDEGVEAGKDGVSWMKRSEIWLESLRTQRGEDDSVSDLEQLLSGLVIEMDDEQEMTRTAKHEIEVTKAETESLRGNMLKIKEENMRLKNQLQRP